MKFKLFTSKLASFLLNKSSLISPIKNTYFTDFIDFIQYRNILLYHAQKEHLRLYYSNFKPILPYNQTNIFLLPSSNQGLTIMEQLLTIQNQNSLPVNKITSVNDDSIIYLPSSWENTITVDSTVSSNSSTTAISPNLEELAKPSIVSSGLLNLNEKEKLLFYKNLDEKDQFKGDEFIVCLFTLISKILYHVDNTKYSSLEEFLSEGIKNIFKRIEPSYIPKELYAELNERTLPLLQHFLVYIAGNKGFSRNILENLCRFQISCESYLNHNTSILTFIELMNLKYLIELLEPLKKKITYNLVDHEGVSAISEKFDPNESQTQTNQQHADILLSVKTNINSDEKETVNLNDDNTFSFSMDENKTLDIYIDVKSYVTLGLKERRFALFHGDYKKFKRYINDIKTCMQKFINDNKITDKHFLQAYDSIKNLSIIPKSAFVLDKIRENYLEIMQIIITLIIPSAIKYPLFRPGLAIEVGIDKEFSEFYVEQLKLQLETLKNNRALIEKVLPENRVINEANRIQDVTELIKTIFPPDQAERISQTFIEWMP